MNAIMAFAGGWAPLGKKSPPLAQDLVGLPQLPVLPLQGLQPGGHLGRHTGRTSAVTLRLLQPFIERLPGAADFGGNRDDRRPSRRVLALMIQHQPNRAFTHLGRKLVRRLACHRSTFSGVGASDKPGAVHTAFGWITLAPKYSTNSVFTDRA